MSPKWMGKCPECGGWNTMVEEREAPAPARDSGTVYRHREGPAHANRRDKKRGRAPGFRRHRRARPRSGRRHREGSVVLIGGDPGIGKSTLMLQAMDELARPGKHMLYRLGRRVTAADQDARRSPRYRRGAAADSGGEHRWNASFEQVADARPGSESGHRSIQTVSAPSSSRAPGSIGQVRESAARLVVALEVKSADRATLPRGPRDQRRLLRRAARPGAYGRYGSVLRGRPRAAFRILRAVKNRFGSTDEIGLFEMKESGSAAGGQPIGAVPGRASRRSAGLGGHRQHRGDAPHPRRGAGAGVPPRHRSARHAVRHSASNPNTSPC